MHITHTTSHTISQVNPGIQHLTVDRHVLFLILLRDQFQRFERSDCGVFQSESFSKWVEMEILNVSSMNRTMKR